MPPAPSVLGLEVAATVAPTGELDVADGGSLLTRTELRPGASPVAGAVRITNIAAKRVAVRVRTKPLESGLDTAVQVRLSAGGETVFQGPLPVLHHWTARSFPVDSTQGRQLRLDAWLDPATPDGYQGRTEALELELLATPEEG